MDDRRPGRREAPGAQDPAYRPARPPHASPPASTGDAAGLTRRERSRYFSMFLTASRRPTARRRPQESILRAGTMWHPVDLAQSDHTAARGQPFTEPARASPGSAPGLPCGSPPGGRWDATPRPPDLAGTVLGGWSSWRSARPARAFLLGADSLRELSTAVQRCGLSRGVSWEASSCIVS
jgi:hypothetical protein